MSSQAMTDSAKRYPMIEFMKRGPFDKIDTPAVALDPLLPHLPKNALIWESAPGKRALVERLREAGRDVTYYMGRDFFNYFPSTWDIQVTNPPFSIKHKWLERSEELRKPWALLLPVTTLGVGRCQPYLEGCEILFFPKRIDFTGKKAPWFAVAWFTKGLNIGKQLNFA